MTGLYFFDEFAPELVKSLKFSNRGELEITDLNNIYINNNKLNLITLDKNFTWMDAGTPRYVIISFNVCISYTK